MDPSGTFVQCDARAIGSASEGAQSSLQEVYHKVTKQSHLWTYHVYSANISLLYYFLNQGWFILGSLLVSTPDSIGFTFVVNKVQKVMKKSRFSKPSGSRSFRNYYL